MASEVMFQHGLAVLSELVSGFLRFGLDRLGGAADDGDAAAGGLPLESCHPYGLRSRPRDPDKDSQGNPTRGAGLLVIERGGGDDGAIPTADPRITDLPDEGKGGSMLYAWTGSGAPSSLVISGDDGKARITAPETIIGAEAAGALVKEQQLMTWITSTLLPALASSPGGPIVVTPPSGLATTKLRSE